MFKVSQKNHVPPYGFAKAYEALRKKEVALERLEKSYEEQDTRLALMRVDPVLDSLRADPRFQSLLRRLNFSE